MLVLTVVNSVVIRTYNAGMGAPLQRGLLRGAKEGQGLACGATRTSSEVGVEANIGTRWVVGIQGAVDRALKGQAYGVCIHVVSKGVVVLRHAAVGSQVERSGNGVSEVLFGRYVPDGEPAALACAKATRVEVQGVQDDNAGGIGISNALVGISKAAALILRGALGSPTLRLEEGAGKGIPGPLAAPTLRILLAKTGLHTAPLEAKDVRGASNGG